MQCMLCIACNAAVPEEDVEAIGGTKQHDAQNQKKWACVVENLFKGGGEESDTTGGGWVGQANEGRQRSSRSTRRDGKEGAEGRVKAQGGTSAPAQALIAAAAHLEHHANEAACELKGAKKIQHFQPQKEHRC